jgi:DUF2905 family protein
MNQRSVAMVLIAAGAVLLLIGVLVRLGAFSWFGRLPGDYAHRGEHVWIFVPITSMILISLLLTLGLYLLRRLF